MDLTRAQLTLESPVNRRSFGLGFFVVACTLRRHVLGDLSEDSGRVASTDAGYRDPPLKLRPTARRTQNMKREPQ